MSLEAWPHWRTWECTVSRTRQPVQAIRLLLLLGLMDKVLHAQGVRCNQAGDREDGLGIVGSVSCSTWQERASRLLFL